MDNIICPFCNEDEFDLIGLKNHFVKGYCSAFNETISVEQERHLTSRSSRQEKSCAHHWVDATNEVIKGGQYCTKCHAISPAA